MTEARLHEIEQLKRDELTRRAHEIIPELIVEIRPHHDFVKVMKDIAFKGNWLTNMAWPVISPADAHDVGELISKLEKEF